MTTSRKQYPQGVPNKKPYRNTSIPATASALFASSKNRNQTCTFCRGQHPTAQCHVVTDIRERRNILRRQGRCYLCLRKAGHLAKDCDVSIKCFNCRGRHHVALCERNMVRFGENKNAISPGGKEKALETQGTQSEPVKEEQQNTKPVAFCGISTEAENSRKSILLQTAVVRAVNPDDPNKSVKLRVILDSGSQRTYITKNAREILKLSTVSKENVIIKVFGSDDDEINLYDLVALKLASLNDNLEINVKCLEVPFICSPLTQGQAIDWARRNCSHLEGLTLADGSAKLENLEVHILLGADFLWCIMTGDIQKGKDENEPVAIGTHFGYVLSGPVSNMPRTLLSRVNLSCTHVLRVSAAQCEAPVIVNYEDSSNQRKLNQMFELDTLGISESDSVHETFLKDVKFENNHYVVSLPWREHHDTLPDNYELCVGRLKSTLRRLRKNPLLSDKYHKVIQDQIEAGIIEEVKPHLQESIPSKEPCRTHYLSHHGVVREEALTTKLRVVFDGSAKVKPDAPSLNECLHTGPSLLPTIIDILLRFRFHRVALVADIEKAFHMLRISEQDKDSLRFLWVNDPYSEDPELLVFRFLRVIFGLNCSPFLLGASLNHHIRKYDSEDPTFVRALLESLYVDDMISGDNEVNSAFELYMKSKLCLADGGFNLRKWRSSSQKLIELIDGNEANETEHKRPELIEVQPFVEDETSFTKTTLGDMNEIKPDHHKVLGLTWNFVKDEFVLDFEKLISVAKTLTFTKRNLLRLTAMFFDPIGFISPVIIEMKIVLQEITVLKLGWDTPLPEHIIQQWKYWVNQLEGQEQLEFLDVIFGIKQMSLAMIFKAFVTPLQRPCVP